MSSALFECFSSALQLVLQQFYNFPTVSHVLDDFIFIGPHNSSQCWDQLEHFQNFASFIGIPIKESKTVLPSPVTIVHGIEIDSVAMQALLPQDKIDMLKTLLHSFSRRCSACLRDWQSLIGSLSFACKVIRPGRPFLRRLPLATQGVSNAFHHIHISKGVRRDCAMWVSFLSSYSGISLLQTWQFSSSPHMHLFSDASDWGYAAIYSSQWIQGHWPVKWRRSHINIREFFPIYLALSVWGHIWVGGQNN